MDKLVECPCCKSDACYHTQEGETFTKVCMTCGFTTGNLMKEGSEYAEKSLQPTAKLIQDLAQVHEGYVWYPIVINLPGRGIIFPDYNKRAQDWYWSVREYVVISENEKERFPDPSKPGEYYTHKLDPKSNQIFDKYEFMDAWAHLGLSDLPDNEL